MLQGGAGKAGKYHAAASGRYPRPAACTVQASPGRVSVPGPATSHVANSRTSGTWEGIEFDPHHKALEHGYVPHATCPSAPPAGLPSSQKVRGIPSDFLSSGSTLLVVRKTPSAVLSVLFGAFRVTPPLISCHNPTCTVSLGRAKKNIPPRSLRSVRRSQSKPASIFNPRAVSPRGLFRIRE